MESTSYRMVVSTEQDFVTAAAVAEQQLAAWLTGKRYDASALLDGRNEIAPNVTLDRDSYSGRRGAYTRWRMRETPSSRIGTWQSTLTVRDDHQDDQRLTWVQLDVEHLPSGPDEQPSRVNTPRIARPLLEALRARDGLADVTPLPLLITPGDVDEVIEELCDPDRRLPIVVASVPYRKDADRWTDSVVEKAFAYLAGLAVLYVLTAEAQPEFNQALEFHPVYGGGVRTYLPGIDLAWKQDAQRHPVMSRSTLEADPRRAAAILAALPQRHARLVPLPQPLSTLPVQRTRPRPLTQGSELERLKSENETLYAILSDAEQTEAARVEEIGELRRERQELEFRTYELSGEYDELYEELQKARRRVRALQVQLEKAGARDLAYAEQGSTAIARPRSFAELLDRIPDLAHIRFTGSRKVTLSLDDHPVDNWVEMAWDGLLALEHFAAASAEGTAHCDFRAWCSSSSADVHPFPVGKVKMVESDAVGNRRRWKEERTFPVPPEVHPDEKVYMQAHLRIGGGNTVAPRLHFYDDGSNTGLLYVGYIGPHLTNTLT
ncbi:hypothetical protein [Kitasatospora sp. HPMI-4]|uniref:hypothetical protein n=1 Tax=Kitasatospora sp. HPMI-4 TaxID=3448443 RepID=UPI003F1DCEAC